MTDHNIYPFYSLYDGKAYLKKRDFPRGDNADMVEHTFTDRHLDDAGRVIKTVNHHYTALCDANHHDYAIYVFHAEYMQRSMCGDRAQNVTLNLDCDRPHFTITDLEGTLNSVSLVGRKREELTDEVLAKMIEGVARQIFKKWIPFHAYDAEKIICNGSTITLQEATTINA